jgi:hypothetical protein
MCFIKNETVYFQHWLRNSGYSTKLVASLVTQMKINRNVQLNDWLASGAKKCQNITNFYSFHWLLEKTWNSIMLVKEFLSIDHPENKNNIFISTVSKMRMSIIQSHKHNLILLTWRKFPPLSNGTKLKPQSHDECVNLVQLLLCEISCSLKCLNYHDTLFCSSEIRFPPPVLMRLST